MVKTDSKRINVRLRTPVRYALEDLMERWGLGMTPTLEKLILDAHGGKSAEDKKPMELKRVVTEVESDPSIDYETDWGA